MNPILGRLHAGSLNPVAIGLASFVATVALIFGQPGVALA